MSNETLKQYFQEAIKVGVSDLFLVTGEKPMVRVEGVFRPLIEDKLIGDDLKNFIFNELVKSETIKKDIEDGIERDLIYVFEERRFRMNVHLTQGEYAIAARLISNIIPNPKFLNFHKTVYEIPNYKNGLVLFTGSTGSGKSSVMASLLQTINQTQDKHIITIEDPIEFVIPSRKSLVEHRQIIQDTKEFSQAVRAAFRQDPDILMIGELRDMQTIYAALTAAETGHLVFASIHAPRATDVIERIVNIFSKTQHTQILHQLANSLRAVVARKLLPRAGGGPRVAAWDIMVNTPAIANLIRENKIANIGPLMEISFKEGMTTFKNSIAELKMKRIVE